MKTHLALAASAALLALAATSANAADKAPSRNQCFWTRNADGFAAQDQHTVNIRVNVRDVYQFEMLGTCPDIDWNQRIALVSRGGSSICTGMDAEIVTHSPIGPMRCAVRSVKKLTPEEIAALPRRARP
jgi:opacity protein-like surface antigen